MIAAAALLVAVSSSSQALAAAPLAWSTPATIDSGQRLNAIACPSRSLCVAVDAAGRLFASTAPAAGASSWKQVESDFTHALTSVACASVRLCAAVDDGGRVLLSDAPAAVGSWTQRAVDGGAALSSISCPNEALCVAVDRLGRALVGENPGSGAALWRSPVAIDSGHALDSVSCASAQLCVAVDDAGVAFATQQPAGGALAWRARDIDGAHALLDVSCGTGSICVALDEFGSALASADPAGTTPTWSSTGIDPGASGGTGAPAGVSCASSGLCVAVDGSEDARASDNPTDALPAWSVSHAGLALDAVSCAADGFCAALGGGGRVLSASVPAPVAATGAPTEVGQTTATLAGAVNPDDAQLGDCRFEYGPTAAYGQSAPCSSLSLAGSVAQPVATSLAGLTPGTTYHYRLVALSGAGEGVGPDETFTTVTATLVHPHPSISGVPAVGSRLACDPGVPVGEAIALAYEWRRDGGPIAGAHSAVYRVARADATHHIQCLVTAVNAAGSSTGHSAFVAIPAQGVVVAVNETVVGRAFAQRGRVSVFVKCSPRAVKGCAISLRLTSLLRDRHRRLVSVVVGSSSVRLARGQRRVVSVALDGRGRSLLSHAKHLTVELSVKGTIIGVLNASLSRQRLTLGSSRRRR
ncbi:MAG: hypothetical protein ACTHM1_03700 [Solirubrobacteraceae bacterium]